MIRERRRSDRLDEDRRESPRLVDYRTVHWREGHDADTHTGVLVDFSANGLGLLVENAEAPPLDALLVPERRPDCVGWTRPAVVNRLEPLSGSLSLVGAEFGTPEAEPAPLETVPDRRRQPRRGPERRRSTRWATSKDFRWRLHRGRRIREGRILQRSLDGIAFVIHGKAAPAVGRRLYPADRDQSQRAGFRAAIVRRCEKLDGRTQLVCAELEA